MAIVMPTDLGDANVWGPILDTALGTVVDRHDHTTGKGVKISSAALKINADVSWSDSGLSWSITDLKAVDFTPSAVQTALAGALFVSDGTSSLTANELYWRTTSGVNVKLTAGSALNVAAFTGGIGGDYSAVGALVVFDDATDSYWFQQQVGTGVRQYARMRSADVDLYEFKAHPTAGVPTNRVRLASPAALAASYTLTMPTALPSVGGLFTVSSAGVTSIQPVTLPTTGRRPLWIDPSAAITASFEQQFYASSFITSLSGVAQTSNSLFSIGINGQASCPLTLITGQSLTSWSLFLSKASASSVTVTASLVEVTAAGASTTISTDSSSANGPVNVTLSAAGTVPIVNRFYSIVVTVTGGGAVSDSIRGYGVLP